MNRSLHRGWRKRCILAKFPPSSPQVPGILGMGNEVGKGILGGSWPARGDLGYNWSLRAKFVDYIVEFTIV